MLVSLRKNEVAIHSINISISDIDKMLKRLTRCVHEQGRLEIEQFVTRNAQETEEDFAIRKNDVHKNVFKVTLSIGGDSITVIGTDENLLFSEIRPTKIDSIFMTNVTEFENTVGTKPLNSFSLLLDFSKPPLLDYRNPLSGPTPNLSNLSVQGTGNWVPAVTDAVMGVLGSRQTNRSWVHRAFVYDTGLFVLGIPLSIYAMSKATPFIAAYSGSSTFVSVASYIYLTTMVIWGYRIAYGYAKWAFPTVELQDNNDSHSTHRFVLGTLGLGLAGTLIWEIMQALWA